MAGLRRGPLGAVPTTPTLISYVSPRAFASAPAITFLVWGSLSSCSMRSMCDLWENFSVIRPSATSRSSQVLSSGPRKNRRPFWRLSDLSMASHWLSSLGWGSDGRLSGAGGSYSPRRRVGRRLPPRRLPLDGPRLWSRASLSLLGLPGGCGLRGRRGRGGRLLLDARPDQRKLQLDGRRALAPHVDL